MNGEIKQWPLYKNAVVKFLDLHPEPGFVLPDAWLEVELELEFKVTSYEEFNVISKQRLAGICGFKRLLMRKHQIHLLRVASVGYRVLAPHEVTRVTMARYRSEAVLLQRRAADQLLHVPIEKLDDDALRENAEARARLAQLRKLSDDVFTLPPVRRRQPRL